MAHPKPLTTRELADALRDARLMLDGSWPRPDHVDHVDRVARAYAQVMDALKSHGVEITEDEGGLPVFAYDRTPQGDSDAAEIRRLQRIILFSKDVEAKQKMANRGAWAAKTDDYWATKAEEED